MRTSSLLLTVAFYAACVLAHSVPRDVGSVSIKATCQQLQSQLSRASTVYLPGSTGFETDVEHYFNSSAAEATCSVEPGSAADVGKILQTIEKTQVPFAIKGGGHSGNAGFSSTTGIQISMTRFNEIVYHASNGTVDLGTGRIWDDVYTFLAPLNVTLPGTRVTGVGVAGFSLGGGLNYFANQVGFAVDNIVRVQLVLPNGQFVTASAQTNPDLFFAVRGGYNNFGIVTQITYKAIHRPAGQVWGGLKVVGGDQLDAVTNATLRYIAEVNDPKSALVVQYMGVPGQAGLEFALSMFYDGTTPAPGVFDDFLALPSTLNDVSARNMTSLVQTTNAFKPSSRGNYNTAAVSKATPAIVNAVINQTLFWTEKLANTSVSGISIAVEAFLPSIFQQAAPGSSAYPPNRSLPFVPLGIVFQWNNASDDKLVAETTTQSAQEFGRIAASEGQDVDAVAIYDNYASSDTWPSQRIYGANWPRLQDIKRKYDPSNIMGLAGGWKVTA